MPIRITDVRLGSKELENVTEAVKTNWISSRGPFIKRFEENFANYIGKQFGVATTSGTTALHLALVALGIKSGDEVIIPNLTNIVNYTTVKQTGATAIFADVTKDYWCIDPQDIARKITSRTKAIVVVHVYGHPCDMDPIMEEARKHNIHVIEDCAEAHGAEYKGKKVGSFGIINCFSFYANKVITTGEGGMCLTDDAQLAYKMKRLRDIGFDPKAPLAERYKFNMFGYNYRMTNMQAGIGVAQLEKLDEIIQRRREIGQFYNDELKDVVTLQTEMPWAKSVYWYYSVLLKDESTTVSTIKKLAQKGIDTRPLFYPLNETPIVVELEGKSEILKVSSDIGKRGINIPSSPHLSEEELQYVVKSIKECLI